MRLPRAFTMEVAGRDANVVVTSDAVTIWWKSLRGRLSSPDGGIFEVIPLANLLDVHLIHPTTSVGGCLQFVVIRERDNFSLALDENWFSTLHEKGMYHTVLFDHPHSSNFTSLHSHLDRQLNFSKNTTRNSHSSLLNLYEQERVGA